jgi:hypothetical protein
MIIKDLAEYEKNDSELAKYTIANLHNEIERLNNIINKALKYIDTWGYDEYELFRIDENEPDYTTDENVITIVETLENILKGDNKE